MNEDCVVAARQTTCSPWRALLDKLSLRIERWQAPDSITLILLALLIGIGAGYGAVLFRWLISSIQHLAFVDGRVLLSFMGHYYVIIVPALGGMIVGPLIYFFAREAKGHGVPEVMEAVALRGGRIRPIVVIVKALASSICIGTGGSVGREGPIVQIGSAFGSTIGQVLHLTEDRLRILVACGAAGGIAATFNAPIAGALFALEVIIADFSAANFVSVVISAVTAGAIGRIVLGNDPAFIIPAYRMVTVWELFFYALLGILAAVVGTLFVRILYKTEDIFDAWKFPEYLKPIPGGLIIGAIGLFFPQIFGVGYEAIGNALVGDMGANLLLALVVLKIVATSITIGSGGSGGVFAPSLFLGSMLGGLFGAGIHTLFPTITASSGAYAVVGMAALFSAAARAPLTSIIIVFEMTNDYRIILPLMFATVISTVLAELLSKESIYTMKLARRGVHLTNHRDIDVMQGVLVEESMSTDINPIAASKSLSDLAAEFERSHHHGLPVVDGEGELIGVVTIGDLEEALIRPDSDGLTVGDIATTDPLVAYPREPMWAALRRLATNGLGRLPVVDPDNPRHLIGMIRRRDVIKAYNTAILHRMEDQHRRERLKLGRLLGTSYVELTVEPGSSAAGKALRELDLPETCLIVAIQRDRQTIVAHGDTVLEPGDRITAITSDEVDPGLRRCVTRVL